MRVRGFSEKTIEDYTWSVRRFFRQVDIDPGAVTEDHVIAWLDGIRVSTRGPRGDCSVARWSYAKALRSFFSFAASHGFIEADPAAAVKVRTPALPEPDAYSDDELVRILVAAAARSPKRAWAMLACYSLGLRKSELLALEPDDIDWAGGRVYIANGKGHKPRVVKMGPTAREALTELQRYSSGTGTVVGPLAGMTFWVWVSEAARDAGLPPHRRRAHMLRSTAATKMLREGIPISVVSKFLGHSGVAVTSRYLAVTDLDRDRAVAVL